MRLNLFLSCLITVCLHGKVIVIRLLELHRRFVAVVVNIHNEVSFYIECVKDFFPFPSIPFTISRAQ